MEEKREHLRQMDMKVQIFVSYVCTVFDKAFYKDGFFYEIEYPCLKINSIWLYFC